MYANRVQGNVITKKSKGVKKSIVENEIIFEDYLTCLQSKKQQLNTMNVIRRYKHDLYSVELNKISLSAHDDKRYILYDGISTSPWGHYKIPQDHMMEMEVDTALAID